MKTREREGIVPFGPREVRVIVESCLQASMFLRTASSRPERCLWPSLSIVCIPCGCIWNPIFTLHWLRSSSSSSSS
jgi:hypothetical protein